MRIFNGSVSDIFTVYTVSVHTGLLLASPPKRSDFFTLSSIKYIWRFRFRISAEAKNMADLDAVDGSPLKNYIA